jgi:hypothetical protein
VTGGLADAGDTTGSTAVDFVVCPVVISEVTGEVNLPESDTIVALCSSETAAVSAPMATIVLPPITADNALTRERGFGWFGFISRHLQSVSVCFPVG